jgi:hypothetical protein
MQMISFFGLGVFGLVSLAVALRLLLLSSHSRQLPEFLIGLSFLTGGVLGRGLVAMGLSADSLPEVLRVGLYMGGRFMLVICCLAIGLMAWRVFQRGQAWARGLFLVLLAVLAIHSAIDVFVTLPGKPLYESFGFWIGTVAKTGAFAWGSWEAVRYYRMLRRRIPLGLADPVVANRIALWGVAAGLIAFLFVMNPIAQLLTGVSQESPVLSMVQSLIGLAVAVCIALAFFPPQAYVQRIQHRAAHQESCAIP